MDPGNDSHDSDPDDPTGRRFKKPFKIYENFRNVYKGVQRKKGHLSQCYEVAEVAAASASSVVQIVPIIPEGNSLDSFLTNTSSSDDEPSKTRKISDGNTTDDSGIDSICSPEPSCSRNELIACSKISGAAKQEAGVWKGGTVKAVATTFEKPEDPVYSKVDVQKKRKVQPVVQVVDGIDIGEGSQVGRKVHVSGISDLTALLNNTSALLNRHACLRASLKISVKKNSKHTVALPIPDDTPLDDAPTEEDYPSLADLEETPFVRHNPNRRPVSEVRGDTVCRRSIRLAPRTVANLANKFDGLINRRAETSKMSERELKLCRKDITKIVGTLEPARGGCKPELLPSLASDISASLKEPQGFESCIW